MNIGFYGHSNCAYRSPDSFIDIVERTLGATVVNIGVRQGSEERILFELKKTKNLDFAIIFHSEPQFIFLPDCDRDIGLNHITESKTRTDYLFKDWDIKCNENNFLKTHNKKFIEKFQSPDNFLKSVENFKNYYYHPDLQKNRFYGALMQIDHYLIDKNIPCIHVVQLKYLPTWFKFNSGIVDYEIMQIVKKNTTQDEDINGVSKQENILIANILLEKITELFGGSKILPAPGRLAERFIAPIPSVGSSVKGLVSSNLTPSAKQID